MRTKRIMSKCIAAFLALIMCMSTAVFAEEPKTGWQSEDGKVFYYENDAPKKGPWVIEEEVDGGYYYIGEDGARNASFTGFAQGNSGWWYVEGGKVTRQYNGLIKTTLNNKLEWWNVRGSRLTVGPTVAQKSKGSWWYIDAEGKVDKSFTGLAKNEYGWWYCKNGKVNFKYKGLAKNEGKTWYVNKGKVRFGFTGIKKINKKYYYVKKGEVQTGYSGKVKYNGATYSVKKGVAKETASGAMVAKAQGYSSSTKWLVLVDTKKNRLAAFSGSKGNWKLRRTYKIADGKATPKGQFSMGARWNYYDSLAGNRCWYCITIKGNYLFHSVLCDPRYNYPKVKNGTVGKTISKGCIRQPVKDAKWLYKTCPRGTKIVIY